MHKGNCIDNQRLKKKDNSPFRTGGDTQVKERGQDTLDRLEGWDHLYSKGKEIDFDLYREWLKNRDIVQVVLFPRISYILKNLYLENGASVY